MPFLYVAHPKSINYQKELYQPLASSRLAEEYELVFPHYSEEYVDSRALFEAGKCTAMIAEISAAATGVGAEIAFATVNGVEIVGVCRKGSKPSGTAKRFCKHLVEYDNENELISGLENIFLGYSDKG